MSAQSALKPLIETAGIKLVNSTEIFPALHQPGDAGLPMLVGHILENDYLFRDFLARKKNSGEAAAL